MGMSDPAQAAATAPTTDPGAAAAAPKDAPGVATGTTEPTSAASSPTGVTGQPATSSENPPPAAAAADPPKPDDPPAPEKQPDFVRQAFARLTEKKGEFRRQQEQHKGRLDLADRHEAVTRQWEQDPGAAVEALFGEGAFERLVEHYGTKGRPATPDDRVSAIEKQLAEERQERQRLADEQAERDRAATITAGVSKVETMCRANADAYEDIVLEGAFQKVFDVMVQWAKLNPDAAKAMPPGELFEKAASAVEKDLGRANTERLDRQSKSKKYSGRFAPPKTAPVSDPPPGATAIPGSVTLTSKVTGDAPPAAPPKVLSREESIAETSRWLAEDLKRQQAASAA